nr:2,3-bisphosphoglycerate-independent phosphoglycerate mutase [Quercus suber]
MSYNDDYMVWFRPRTVRHITRETLYWDTLVESQLRIMEKCEPGSEIYNDCINALRAVEELGRLTLDDARTAGNTSEPAVGRGRQAGRRQRQGGRQSSQGPTSGRHQTPVPTSGRRQTPVPPSGWRQTPVPISGRPQTPVPTSGRRHTPVPTFGRRHTPVPTSGRRHTPVPTSGWRHTPVHDHTMEEASQTVDEMCLDIGYDMGSMAHDDAGPSHTFVHGDTSQSPSMRSDDTCPPTSPTTSPLPTTRMAPPLTTGTASADVHGRDEMRFMPTPGVVPPEFVHTEFIQTQIPAPPPEASHIQDRLRRLQRTRTHPPDCGTGHGKVRPVKEPSNRYCHGEETQLTGFWGLWGSRVDAIDHYTDEIAKLSEEVPIAIGGPGLAPGCRFRRDIRTGGLPNVATTIMNLHGFGMTKFHTEFVLQKGFGNL